jgi:peptidoglycan hydrolase CwlO-like protein
MTEPVTWAAVGMAAVSQVASWLVIIRSIRTDRAEKKVNDGDDKRLEEIKGTVEDTNGKIDALEGQVGSMASKVEVVKTKVEGMQTTCAETRKGFAESIKLNADRIFYHVSANHKEKP